MKTPIYISGIASAVLMLCGCLFKVMHWPGAGILLILSVSVFCLLFLPASLVSSYREKRKYGALHIVTFIVFFISMAGLLFKVMHWPGAKLFLLAGIPLPFVLFLPVYLYQTRHEKKDGVNFLGVMFGLTFLAVFTVLLSLNVSRDVLSKATLLNDRNERSAAFCSVAVQDIPVSEALGKRSDELCNYIDALKCELLSAAGNNLCVDSKPKQGYSFFIGNPEEADAIAGILSAQSSREKELEQKVSDYRDWLLASGKMDAGLASLCKSLLYAGSPNSGNQGEEHGGTDGRLSNPQLIFALNALSQLKSNVRLVEAELLASAR
jgi:hypothetical protein